MNTLQTKNRAGLVSILACVLALAPWTGHAQSRTNPAGSQPDVQHVNIYYDAGRFAGWPANLGIWSWGDEILVGFVEAAYHDDGGFHTYDQSTARDKFARSRDGGLTWTIEDAYEHGQTAWRYNNRLEDGVEEPEELSEPIDFTHSDLALTFLRRTNNIGPSHFYYSYDRGRQWQGPFALPNLDTPGIATRTDYIIDGPHELLAFFTVAKSNDREGRVLAARTTNGGVTWEQVAWVGPEPEGFEIMPSSVRLSSSEVLTVIRRREGSRGEGSRQDLMSAYRSTDNGHTWERVGDPVANTGNGGSPPALVKLDDGRLALAYVVRSSEGSGSRVGVKFSADEGQTWSEETVLRQDGATSDAGYPRMVQRPDGKLVVVYYWNRALEEGQVAIRDRQPWRFIAATIFDPDAIF